MIKQLFTGLILIGALPLASCGQNDQDEGVGGVTASEARALNEAAEMLDNSSPAPARVTENSAQGASVAGH